MGQIDTIELTDSTSRMRLEIVVFTENVKRVLISALWIGSWLRGVCYIALRSLSGATRCA